MLHCCCKQYSHVAMSFKRIRRTNLVLNLTCYFFVGDRYGDGSSFIILVTIGFYPVHTPRINSLIAGLRWLSLVYSWSRSTSYGCKPLQVTPLTISAPALMPLSFLKRPITWCTFSAPILVNPHIREGLNRCLRTLLWRCWQLYNRYLRNISIIGIIQCDMVSLCRESPCAVEQRFIYHV